MKISVSSLAILGLLAATQTVSPGQTSRDEPTTSEMERAYRSKSGEGGVPLVPNLRWERWRIKQIRGWTLHFNRTSEKRWVGVVSRGYRAIAKKNGACAEYQITDTMPLAPNIQIKPSLIVEPAGIQLCP